MERADILILGGGLVGSALGTALDAHGITSIIVDTADPQVILAAEHDGRASAIASAPHRMLQAIGVADRLGDAGCPIRSIRVSDGLEPGKLDFDAGEGEDALGTMYENRILRRALHESAKAAEKVDLRMKTHAVSVTRDAHGVTAELSDGTTVHAALLVGAEGRNSPTRDAALLRVARWQYDHAAIVTGFHHEHPHDNVAFEIFYPEGPFALLPLNDDEHGHRSAVVWTVRRDQAAGMLKLSERGVLAEAMKQTGGFLGELSRLAPRSSYPLGFHHAAKITSDRLALVGDAAHGIHPIAGQGVNVGFRDVAALTEVLVEGKRLGMDPGDAQILARYERWRSLDTFMVSLATDGLTRLFGMPGKSANRVRRVGLDMVDRLPFLKDAFMAEARGESGEVPRLLQGSTV
ncbi:FAD-dependent monooxygenase [Stakelama pacifica]|uniref:2-octaprenyl-3-methyl-6-methoxy-1,4-benzoquinol hydroxylase n=1 Tax=Stakelama pacifica TaxID=517720 RepID=A0A4R6FBE6_9SPHN|nr:FAD-dependent monooxygenase [Stakelama pacifica]TDN78402.1 2-octaprenyl-3-methyl-6-methoxy-1,4-benzoquinol hydroxylase [Stakelama pacifica]GGO99514.1 2-octaprenyl-3-methyl-6-methoxy-1,4-benzoquinol hydroxylase [Stakelama pacifica]